MEFIRLVIDFWFAVLKQTVSSGFVDVLMLFLLVSFSIICIVVIWREVL